MPDNRSLVEKLRAMASADESPHEAAIAQAKLAEMGDVPPPRKPPTAVGGPAFDSGPWSQTNTTVSGGSFTISTVWIYFAPGNG